MPVSKLRHWRGEDAEAMAAINRDPEVTRYLNRPVDEQAVQAFFGAVSDHWNQHGFGFYAVESGDPEASNCSSPWRDLMTRSMRPSE